MRILMVSQLTPYLPCHDGFRLVPAHLLRELSGRHTLALVSGGSAADTPDQQRWAASYCEVVRTLPPLDWQRRWTATPAPPVARAREVVARVADAFAPDVIHIEGAGPAPLARTGGIPTVIGIHDSRALRAREFRRLARTPWDWARAGLRELEETRWERRWLPAADRCLVLSDEDRAEAARWLGPDRVQVMANGIDLGRHEFRRAGQPRRLVFTGNFAWPPNADAARRFALAVFPRLRRRWPDAEFVIAGADPVKEVRALGALPGVRVTGTLPDLRPSIWSAAVYVSPLRAGFGVKNKILEAMALGTPIVATSRSLSGLAGALPGEHLLHADSDDEIAVAVERLLGDPALGDRLADNARRLVEEQYAWPVVVARYEAVLHAVAGAPAATRLAA
jgi:glycosyltransferase involved in cell wall biosynthesis